MRRYAGFLPNSWLNSSTEWDHLSATAVTLHYSNSSKSGNRSGRNKSYNTKSVTNVKSVERMANHEYTEVNVIHWQKQGNQSCY